MNSFGRLFRIMIAGESHGPGIMVILDGVPAGITLAEEDFLPDLMRRMPNVNGTTARKENVPPHILSGVCNTTTTGAPLTVCFPHNDTRSHDYEQFRDIPRPGHADLTARQKFFGYNDHRGGGHFSGRVTVGIVAAGVVAKKVTSSMQIHAELIETGGSMDSKKTVADAMAAGDSCGGIVRCTVNNVPAGLGEPFFDSCESVLSHAMFAIPGIKGIQFGAGFDAARMKGSEHNDRIVDIHGTTATNHAGGINGGITNGNPLVFTLAVKPTSSISTSQETCNIRSGEMETLVCAGRHDACFALRVPVIVEAMTACVLADLLLQQHAYLRPCT